METLCLHVAVEKYKTGENVITQGDIGTSFYLIHHGEVNIHKKSSSSNDTTIVGSLRMGDFFGERALMHNDLRAATITAVKDVTCLVIQKQVCIVQCLNYNL